MSDQIQVLQDYHSAYNEIVQPEIMVYQSRYYVRRWKPSLGGNGDAIVMALRSLGYYNRETGEKRDGIPIDLPELAKLCGVSVPTLKREFGSKKDGTPTNASLHLFVQREKNYRRDKVTGQIWREENIYRVKMDDPIHPDDMPRLQEILEARQKGAGDGKSRMAQNEPKGKSRMAQNEPQTSQSESLPTQSESSQSQSESAPTQNEPTLKTTSGLPQTPLNSSPTPVAPGDSLSLFSGEDPERSGLSAEEIAAVRAAVVTLQPEPPKKLAYKDVEAEWQAMSDEAKEPFRSEAVQEYKARGYLNPSEAQIGPTMFKLFWARRKGADERNSL
jgi:hypothetical protein